jgi:hypothetical protein
MGCWLDERWVLKSRVGRIKLTCRILSEARSHKVPYWLVCGHSQRSHQWRIGEGASVAKLYLRDRELGESRWLTVEYPKHEVSKHLFDWQVVTTSGHVERNFASGASSRRFSSWGSDVVWIVDLWLCPPTRYQSFKSIDTVFYTSKSQKASVCIIQCRWLNRHSDRRVVVSICDFLTSYDSVILIESLFLGVGDL